MNRRWWVGGVVVAGLASGLWAKQGVVRLKDGSPPLVGDVDESKEGSVTVTIHGVQETVPRDNVGSIEYPVGDVAAQFKDRLAKLAPRDVAGRIDLAHFAYEAGRYDLARRAAAEALAIEPGNAQAQEFMATINHQAALARHVSPDTGTHAGGATGAGGTGGTGAGPGQPEKRYLSPDDVNAIRQAEIKPTDTNLRVTFDHDVQKRFLSTGADESRNFYALRPADRAMEILEKGDPAMAADVRIESDPASLAEYRSRVQTIVLSGCAASGCHNASTAAGGFGLWTGDDTPAAWYTNFYMLQTYAKRDETAAGGRIDRPMLDRTYPEKSLLAQYGLPQTAADTPHPKAENFKQTFSGINDPHYRQLVGWMGSSLKPNGGEYPSIRYLPPWAGPTTRPAALPVPPAAGSGVPSGGSPPTSPPSSIFPPPDRGAAPGSRPR